MRKTLTVIALIALAGCATTPTPPNTAELVSPDSIYGFQEKTAVNTGKITVIRDSGFAGSGCDLMFYIEGKRAATIATGEKATFYVQPGDVNLGASPIFSGLCGSAAVKTIATKIRPDHENLFRLSGDMQGFYLSPYVDYGGK